MKVSLSRVKEASVSVENKIVGEINYGYLLYVGLTHSDTEEIVSRMTEKVTNLRIMPDEDNKMNKTLSEVNGSVLVVPNFTLYADTSGRRPGFKDAARPDQAIILFDFFVAQLLGRQIPVEKGIFGADMLVQSINDGPLNLILEINPST